MPLRVRHPLRFVLGPAYRFRHAILFGLGALALLVVSALLAPSDFQPEDRRASATCEGVTLSPSSRVVRRGGRVTVVGRVCDEGSPRRDARIQLRISTPVRRATQGRGKRLALIRSDQIGTFWACPRLKVGKRARLVRITARDEHGDSGSTVVKLSSGGGSSCKLNSAGEPAGIYQPPPPETGNPNCPLSQPESDIGYTLPGACTTVASDTSQNPDPIPFWGRIDCANASRHQKLASGGDPAPTATGGAQGDSAYRRMTAIDGDDFYGERCELGQNEKNGPVAFYHEGMRRVTYASFKLNDSYPLSTQNWQGVLQLKQAQSSDNGGGTPVLSLGAYDGRWLLFHSDPGYTDVDEVIWDAPAYKNRWTRVAIDAHYSQYASVGWIKAYIDLNADGDFDDTDEQSPRIHTNTLKYETGTDTSDGIAAGQSIPSHLRVGMYHASQIACPAPVGCAVEADNVQVVKP